MLTIFWTSSLFSQESEIPKIKSNFDVAVGTGKEYFSGALSWNRTHGLGSSNKFRLGYGVRISSLSGKNIVYTSAPANLAADLTKVDTLNIEKSGTVGLNAVINIQYQLSSKFLLGFNIDAIGVGLGSETTGNFISSDNNGKFPAVQQKLTPTGTNVLLVGNNDIGQLKSEIFIGYDFSEKIGARLGLDLTFSEYKTATKLTNDNDRFRNKANLLFLAVSYNL
jgi:hypothetical protein